MRNDAGKGKEEVEMKNNIYYKRCEEKLKKFARYLERMPEIRAMMYFGSTASKKMDKHSDIDIDLIIRDKDYKKVCGMLPNLLSLFGEIKFYNKYPHNDEVYAFIGEDYLKIEIDPKKESDLKPSYWMQFNRVEFDKTGKLDVIIKESSGIKKEGITEKDVIESLLGLRDWVFYIARHYARRQKISAFKEAEDMRWDLFNLYGKVKGFEDFEFIRVAEKELSKTELEFFSKGLRNCNKKKLIKYLEDNVAFSNKIQTIYEKKVRKKINLKLNDKEILEKARKILG